MSPDKLLEVAELALRGMGKCDEKRIALFTDEAKAIAQELDRLRESDRNLRKLCGRAAGWLGSALKVHNVPELPGGPHECLAELEAAAKAKP